MEKNYHDNEFHLRGNLWIPAVAASPDETRDEGRGTRAVVTEFCGYDWYCMHFHLIRTELMHVQNEQH